MYSEALSTKQCMDFSLGEPERIHNIFLSSYASQKILSILLCILERSAKNIAWTSAWVNQKGYHQGETSLTLFFIIHFAKHYPIRAKYPEALRHKIMPAWTSTW